MFWLMILSFNFGLHLKTEQSRWSDSPAQATWGKGKSFTCGTCAVM